MVRFLLWYFFNIPMIIKEIDFYTGSKEIETFPAACIASYSTVS